MKWVIAVFSMLALPVLFSTFASTQVGKTEITKWQYGKNGAVSLTYDDGSINQFRVAVPIMDDFGLPATFFIITGNIPGSRYHGAFIGRPTRMIIEETARIPTNKDNFFERASAIGFLGYERALQYHTHAGEVYDEGKNADEAYRVLDEAYKKVRTGAFNATTAHADSSEDRDKVGWDELRALADRGYEFASHTVTHPRLAVLDDANLVYELEKSRQELLNHLGFRHTFSIECPYGTENERAVQAALQRYQVARNYMPDANVDDLDRSSSVDPTHSRKEYVRWQRGALTETPRELMKSWVDKTAAQGNIWLVLVIHGVDGVGWKPLTGVELKDYFGYIGSKKQSLWVATFQDVTKYIRERTHAAVATYAGSKAIFLVLHSNLTELGYDLPLTLKTYVPKEWKTVEVRQGTQSKRVEVTRENHADYILYQATPNAESITLSELVER